MTPEKISSLISLTVAVVVLIVNFFQWWDVTWGGGLIMRKRIKIFICFCVILLLVAIALLFFPPDGVFNPVHDVCIKALNIK